MKWLSRVFYFCLVAALLGSLVFAGLVFLIIESEPRLSAIPPTSASDTARTKAAAKQVLHAYFSAEQPTSLKFEKADVVSALAVLNRASDGRIISTVNMDSSGARIKGTLRLKDGIYINASTTILPSPRGLDVDWVRAGAVSLPGGVVVTIGEWFANRLLGRRQGSMLVNAIQAVRMTPNTADVDIRPVADIDFTRLKFIRDRLRAVRDTTQLVADPDRVAHYYAYLYDIATQLPGDETVSLSHFIGPAFELAAVRSQDSDPAVENRAALLAIAVLLGHENFQRLIGPVSKGVGIPGSVDTDKVVLAGRRDLRLHFVFSAALRVISDSGLSFAIGELKELLDSGKGGSGFSFADLAADRAGIRFAVWATDENRALQVQQFLALDADEKHYFPSISELEEGISDADFDRRFQNVESATYKDRVSEIDRRIDKATLYTN